MANTRLELDRLFKQAGLGGPSNTQRRMRIAGVLAGEELDIAPAVVRKWKDLDNNQAKAAQAGVRKLLALPEDERPARIEELDEIGRRAAQVPEDGGRDAEPSALDRLRARFADGRAGRPGAARGPDAGLHLGAAARPLRRAGQPGVAEPGAGGVRAGPAGRGGRGRARRREEALGDRMDRLYQSVQQQRAAADQGGDDPGPDEPGE